jgi:hypothetical protein
MGTATDLFADLEHDPAVVFWVDRSLAIVHCNEGWDAFARENGGAGWERPSPYGCSLLDVIPDRLRSLYSTAYRSVFLSGTSWVHHYECSSPEVHRLIRMTVSRSRTGEFLTVVNSLVATGAHAWPASMAVQGVYRGPGDSVTMCCVCRRTLHPANQAWDWVPEYLKAPPPRLVHGLCDRCEGAASAQR